ncbi:MAG: 23S rRNA (guanosine(2251)-2'-O)-methyltransferase [uncultured Acidimicrobiales bacterium]|uniref:23S rRNA (Guanosine(2251)-2'-O)-methyltransferase n=1 Tax=uncultured Acidimicrobiales bacterium TaxID=310071 RepID=A0A6J4J6T7_9ACTN|nr:MAG: 23S rRNA (guanosine(2251)-2'-O)-methyltransferase [uncultured Acidimicrobiales bacterium]
MRPPAERGKASRKAKGGGTPRTAAEKAVAGRAAKADAKGAAKKAARAGQARARADKAGGPRPAPRTRSGDPRVGRPSRDAKGLGGEQVEGRQAVRELLKAGRRRVREVWVAEDVDHADIVTEIERLAARGHTPVRYVSRGKLERQARTDATQGVLALAAGVPEADLDQLAGDPRAFLVCLDGVTDPHNLGAVLRSAEYAGATGAVIPRHRAANVTPTVTKAAAGAVERVPLALVSGMPTALLRLGERGVWRVGLDQDAPSSLWQLDLGAKPVALVLGAEGGGLSRLARQRCDELVRIPRAGSLESLNVAAAGAVALLAVAQARAAAGGGAR